MNPLRNITRNFLTTRTLMVVHFFSPWNNNPEPKSNVPENFEKSQSARFFFYNLNLCVFTQTFIIHKSLDLGSDF